MIFRALIFGELIFGAPISGWPIFKGATFAGLIFGGRVSSGSVSGAWNSMMFNPGDYIDGLAREVQSRCGMPWEDARQELWVYYLEYLQGIDAPLVCVRLRQRAIFSPETKACRSQPESLVCSELRRRARETQVEDLSSVSDGQQQDAVIPMLADIDEAIEELMEEMPAYLVETLAALRGCEGNIAEAKLLLGLPDGTMWRRLHEIRRFQKSENSREGIWKKTQY